MVTFSEENCRHDSAGWYIFCFNSQQGGYRGKTNKNKEPKKSQPNRMSSPLVPLLLIRKKSTYLARHCSQPKSGLLPEEKSRIYRSGNFLIPERYSMLGHSKRSLLCLLFTTSWEWRLFGRLFFSLLTSTRFCFILHTPYESRTKLARIFVVVVLFMRSVYIVFYECFS